jgi:hypothetical protein
MPDVASAAEPMLYHTLGAGDTLIAELILTGNVARKDAQQCQVTHALTADYPATTSEDFSSLS